MRITAKELGYPAFTLFVAGRPGGLEGEPGWHLLGVGATLEEALGHCGREGDFVARQRTALSLDLPDDPKQFTTLWRWRQVGEPVVELEPIPGGTCALAPAR